MYDSSKVLYEPGWCGGLSAEELRRSFLPAVMVSSGGYLSTYSGRQCFSTAGEDASACIYIKRDYRHIYGFGTAVGNSWL